MKKLITFLSLICIHAISKAQISPLVYYQFETNYTNQTGLPVGACSIAGSDNLSQGNSSLLNTTPKVGYYCNFVTPLSGTSVPLNSCALSVPAGGTNSQFISFELIFKADANCGLQDVLSFFRVLGAGERYTAGFEYTADGGSDVANLFFITPSPTLNINNSPGQNNNLGEFERFKVNLDGIDKKKWDYYFDGNWHHIVFWYDGLNGVKRIYIDGELPNGFEIIANTDNLPWIAENALSINESNDFYLLNNNYTYRFLGDIDELAIYAGNTPLPEGQILQHYNEIQSGVHYTQTLAGGTIPTPNYNGALIIDNFAQGHVLGQGDAGSFNSTPALTQIKKFPSARFMPGNNFKRNSNWMSNKHMGGFVGTGQPTTQQIANSLAIQIELATNWNYRFLLSENTSTIGNPQEDVVTKEFMLYAINNHVPDLGWSINTYRAQLRYTCLTQPFGQHEPYIKTQMMNSIAGGEHYLFDGTNYINGEGNAVSPVPDFDECETPNPDDDATAVYAPKISLVNDYDGDAVTQVNQINVLRNGDGGLIPALLGTGVKIQYISENNEISPVFSDYAFTNPNGHFGNSLWNDASVRSEAGVTGSANSNLWFDYLGSVKQSIDNRYSDVNKQGYPGVLSNAGISDIFSSDIFFLNYAVDGMPQYRYNYEQLRETQSSIGGLRYSTADFYPRVPGTWNKVSFAANHGFKWMSVTRNQELMFGDTRIAPFVAAGWNHDEEKNIRPAQWLALLKAVGLMGVDFFHTGFFNESVSQQTGVSAYPQGYIWQASTPVYTQAVLTRLQPFFDNGILMPGDIKYNTFDAFYNAQIGNPSQYNTDGNTYRFNAGSQSRLVVARKMNGGAPVYAITASVQPISNVAGNVTDNQIATVNLDAGISNLKIKANRQGSTYYFDNTNTSNPIFYQIDRWHENTHPDRWTSDFDFEAEVFDNSVNVPNIGTVNSLTNLPIINLDFENFTSYASFNNASQYTEYNFQPRDDAFNNDYELWVLARSRTGNNTGFSASASSVPAGFFQQNRVACITNTNWQWYRLDACSSQPIGYNGLTNDIIYTLKIAADNGELEIDKIYLNAPDNFPFNPSYVLTACGLPVVNLSGTQSSVITETGKRINITANTIFNANATFTNCDIVIASTALINLGTGVTLNIDNCAMYSCNDMWQGIENNGGTVNITNSSVNDAEFAAKGLNGSVMNILNNGFDNNYTSLWFENGNFNSSFVFGNRFDNVGAQLTKAPYTGQDSPHHINVLNVSNILIGKVSALAADKNIFHNALIGINGAASNITAKNNVFTNIGGNNFQNREKYPPPPVYTIPNGAIISAGDQATSAGLTVGGNTANEANTFSGCETAVFAHRSQNVSIIGNTIDLCNDAIRLQSINNRNIAVQNNTITRYQYGICFMDVLRNITNVISGNLLNDGLGYDATHQGVTGIEVQNYYPNTDNLTVSGNTVENTQNAFQFRNIGGCLVCDIASLTITNINNNIVRQVIPANDLQASGNVHYGMWAENCYQLDIKNNTISWNNTPVAADLDFMRGIAISYSKKCNIKENNIIKMGPGIRVFEDNTRTNLLCNTFNECIHGVYLDPAGINNKLSDQGDKVYNGSTLDLANSKSWKNKWVNNIDPNRISGTLAPLYQVDWLYTTTIPEYLPINNVSGLNTFICGQETPICNPPLMDDRDRNEEFAGIIQDTIIPDPDSSTFKYLNREAFYLMAKQNPQLLNMGVPSDALYQQEFNQISQENIGKIADARAAMENDDYTAALFKLYSLVNQNQQEDNMKQTLTINMQGFSTNPAPDVAAVSTLVDIAHQHPFYGGPAVYYARALLRINVEDVLPQLRKAHQQKDNVRNSVKASSLITIPNPTTNNAVIKSNTSFVKGSTLIIENSLGIVVKSYKLPENVSDFSINTSEFVSGIYNCMVVSQSGIASTRLTVIK